MKITKTHQAEWQTALDRGHFKTRRKHLGGEKLTAGLWELSPGARSFPMHTHAITEEAMFVVSGNGVVRTPEGDTPIEPGDYVSFPPGGPAHQLVNTGDQPMVFLAMSATQGFDIVSYPHSKKIAASVGAFPNNKRYVFREADQVDYFDGEEQ